MKTNRNETERQCLTQELIDYDDKIVLEYYIPLVKRIKDKRFKIGYRVEVSYVWSKLKTKYKK